MEKVNELNDVRKLATIAKIRDIQPIEGADNIEKVFVRGWQCVAKKGEYSIGDLCIYVEIDSILPDGLPEEKKEEWRALNKQMSKASDEEKKESIRNQMNEISKLNTRPEFEFLRAVKFHIKTRRIFGEISQGLCLPISIILKYDENIFNLSDIAEDTDVTDILGVTQYIAPDPATLGGIDGRGKTSDVMLVSDEERIENLQSKYERLKEFRYYKTEKLEGCLDENTILETEDGIKTIKEICETKYSGKIKSFDNIKNKIIYTKITNHSIKINTNNKKWFEIELEDGKKITLTENHRVWLPSLNCWRRADELTGDEELLID